MRWNKFTIIPFTLLFFCISGCSGDKKPDYILTSGRFILFTSNRPKGAYHNPPYDFGDLDIYLYDRQTQSLIPLPGLNSNEDEGGGSITRDGRFIIFSVGPVHAEANPQLRLYDRLRQSFVNLPINIPGAAPSITPDGRFIAFVSRDAPNSEDLDIYLYDRQTHSLVPLPGLNAPKFLNGKRIIFYDRQPSINADGRFIAFQSDRGPSWPHDEDIYLYDRKTQSLVPLPGLNSPAHDGSPSISGDGRYIAFASNRTGDGEIYLYDVQMQSFVPLPNLNSVEGFEWSPSISLDGRFIAFTSDRHGREDDDIYLYDRQAQALVPLLGLNSPYWDGAPDIRP